MTDVPRTSFGADTLSSIRTEIAELLGLSAEVHCLAQPVASPLLSALPLPSCATLLNSD